MATANTLSDSGPIFGTTYAVTIDGYSYTLQTVDHDLPVTGEQTRDSSGLFNGGAYTRQQERLSCEINAVAGTPAPSQLVPFAAAFHGFASKNWLVGTLKIKSGTQALRTYTAELLEYKASL
jgi:hypothetical protein